MIESSTSYPHLSFSKDDGFPVVNRIGFKAIHLIAHHLAHGWSPEELALNYPQLTLGEVYSVLAWFADHRDEVVAHLDTSAADARAAALEDRHRQMAARLEELK